MMLVGCSSLDVAPAEALRAAAMEEHLSYVDADPAMDAAQKQRRHDAWVAFSIWIDAALARSGR